MPVCALKTHTGRFDSGQNQNAPGYLRWSPVWPPPQPSHECQGRGCGSCPKIRPGGFYRRLPRGQPTARERGMAAPWIASLAIAKLCLYLPKKKFYLLLLFFLPPPTLITYFLSTIPPRLSLSFHQPRPGSLPCKNNNEE